MDFTATLAVIRSWSLDDRLRLVQAICDDLVAASPEQDLTEAQQRELERRLADDDQTDDVIPWEVIKAEAAARSRQP